MAGFLCFSQRWRRKFLCHIFEILWFYHYVDSELTPSRLKLQALQVDDKLKMFQVIDLIEFYRKKHHFLTYFLRLFSFPFLYFSQETVFFANFRRNTVYPYSTSLRVNVRSFFLIYFSVNFLFVRSVTYDAKNLLTRNCSKIKRTVDFLKYF